jgi:hypothetical protein
MFCTKCGSPANGKKFCTRCGATLRCAQQGVGLLAIHNMATFYVSASLPTLETAPAAAKQRALHSAATRQLNPVTAPAGAVTQLLTQAPKPQLTKAHFSAALLVLLLAAGGFWWNHNATLLGRLRSFFVAPQAAVNSTVSATVVKALETVPAPAPPKAAWQVLAAETRNTSEAQNAAIADKTSATIAPGGQLALAFQAGAFFGDGPQADLHIHGAAKAVSYRVFVRHDAAGTWRRIDVNRRGFTNGCAQHDMGHHGIHQARQVLILNDAAQPLQIDAVSALYQDKLFEAVEQAEPAHQHAHTHPPRKHQPVKRAMPRS